MEKGSLDSKEKNAREVWELLVDLPNLFPGPMAYWDKQERCVFSNSNYVEWFGKTNEQMKAITMREMMSPAVYELNRGYIKNALSGEPQRFQRELVKGDGSIGHVLVQYIPRRVSGEVMGFFAVLTDVTKEVELTKKLSLFEEVFKSVGQGVAVTGLDRRIVYCNEAYLKITGCSMEDALGADPVFLEGPGTDRQVADKLEKVLDARESFEGVVLNYRKSGVAFYNALSITVAKNNHGVPTHFIDVIHDATSEVEAKHQLVLSKSELESRVLLRTKELDQANESLRQSFEEVLVGKVELAKKERQAAMGAMGASIAHELSTPLGNSRLCAQTFASNIDEFQRQWDAGEKFKRSQIDKLLDECSKAAAVLGVNLDRAAEIVSVFKRVSVTEADPTRRDFKLREAVENAAISMRPALDKSLALIDYSQVDALLVCSGSPGAMMQVLVNLIQNSLVHGFKAGCPGKVSILARAISESRMELVYQDDGSGIPEEVLPRIFDSFFTTKREAGGSGIGMNLAKTTIEQMFGGAIEAGNAEGGGAKFRLVFPMVVQSNGPEKR